MIVDFNININLPQTVVAFIVHLVRVCTGIAEFAD